MKEDLTLKDALFKEEFNPAISFFKKASLWIMSNFPDFSGLEGWQLWLRRILFVSLLLYLTFTMLADGITLLRLVTRALILMAAAFIIYAHMIAGTIYTALSFWEEFGLSDEPKDIKEKKPSQ